MRRTTMSERKQVFVSYGKFQKERKPHKASNVQQVTVNNNPIATIEYHIVTLPTTVNNLYPFIVYMGLDLYRIKI